MLEPELDICLYLLQKAYYYFQQPTFFREKPHLLRVVQCRWPLPLKLSGTETMCQKNTKHGMSFCGKLLQQFFHHVVSLSGKLFNLNLYIVHDWY